MTVLPIVGRELRVASRKAATYWLRFGAAFVAVILFTWVFLGNQRYASSADISKIIFMVLSCLFFVFALLAGVLNTADCISEERREGTLGLLFLTDLKGYDVAVGKLVANSLHAFFSLLATFPILALPLLMGGVNKGTVWVVLMVLANTIFFTLCLGLFSSVFCKSAVRAMSLALFLILFFTGGIPLLAVILEEYDVIQTETLTAWTQLSPGYAIVRIIGSLGMVTPMDDSVYHSTALLHGISWAALIIVALWLPRSWKDKSDVKRDTRLRNYFGSRLKGSAEQRKNYRGSMLDFNPVIWLGRRDRSKGLMLWGVFGLAAVCWLWGYLENPNDWTGLPSAILFGLILHTIVRFVLIVESCRLLHEDRKSGALELLFSTPLTVRQLLSGFGNALARSYGYQILFVLIADIVLLAIGWDTSYYGGNDNGILLMIFCGITVFLVDCFAIRWIGLWRGLMTRTYAFAVAWVSGIIFVLPWVLWSLLGLIVALSRIGTGNSAELAMLVWLGINVSVALLFAWFSKWKLYSKLRLIATQPQSRTSRRWGGKKSADGQERVISEE